MAEKVMAGRPDQLALRAGVGAAAGFLLSTLARLACAVVMIIVFLSLLQGSGAPQ